MTQQFRPMLAAPVEKLPIRFPVYISPKIDGIRGVVADSDTILSRKLKPIPNLHVQKCFRQNSLLDGLDGELLVGIATSSSAFLQSTSGLMTHTGSPDFTFWVFDDIVVGDLPFKRRIEIVHGRVQSINALHKLPFRLEALEHHLVHSMEELIEVEDMWLEMGFEGVMIRDPDGLYKYGRSTEKQGWLLKLKRFEDSEAVITGFVEQVHNANEAKVDALGLTERSSHKANQIPLGTLGALVVRDIHHGWEFEIGTGFTEKQRQEIWDNRHNWLGTLIKYQYFAVGMKDKPRFPSYRGPRHPDDL